jgi:cytoskeletal protein RodZ
MADTESGAQWFVRYVFVPILVAVLGGGGLIAILNHGKGQADDKKAAIASDTKATPPASEEEKSKKTFSGSTEAPPASKKEESKNGFSDLPLRAPFRLKTNEPTSIEQAPDNRISAVCYAEDSTSHERLPRIGQLRKY